MAKLPAVACLATAAVVAAEPTDDAPEPQLTAEEILANPLDDDAYQQSSRCLSTGMYRRVEVMNNQVLIFHGRGEERWLNILPNRCLGLQPDMILTFETRGMRLCERDQFSGSPRFGPDTPSIPCSLGKFHGMPKENISAIRDALDVGHKTSTVDRTVRSAGQGSEGEAPQPAE